MKVSDIRVTFAVPSTVSAVVDGNTADPITLLSFIPLPGNIMTDGSYLIAHDVPLNLTDEGAKELAAAFGDSPVRTGPPSPDSDPDQRPRRASTRESAPQQRGW